MKIGKVVSVKSFNFDVILKCDRVKLLLYLLSAFGILFGFFFFSKEGNSYFLLKAIFSKIVYLKASSDFVKSFLFSLLGLIVPVILIIVFGSSAFGVVVIPLTVAFINYIFGGLLAFSYYNYKLSGLAFNAVLLIPTFFFFIIALIICSSSVIKYSLFQLSSLSSSKSGRMSIEFSSMIKKQVLVFVLILCDAILEVVLNKLFISAFDFL